MADLIKKIPRGAVVELQFNRPAKKNAINLDMYVSLIGALESASSDQSVQCVVFTCVGESFTSGNDLEDFVNGGADLKDSPVLRFLKVFSQFEKPIVVAVKGDAVGIGTTLLMHADMVFASPDARFSLPFVKLGLCPEFASSLILPRLAGHVRAFEWLVFGDVFYAKDAREVGLINAIVEDPEYAAFEAASRLTSLPRNAIKTSKQLLKQAEKALIKATIDTEAEAFGKALKGAEFAEAVSAFFEKRSPDSTSIYKGD